MKEGNKSSPVHDYLIPVRLIVMQEPRGANETVPFEVQPKLMMVDKLNRTVRTLGHGDQGQWCVRYVKCFVIIARLFHLQRLPFLSSIKTCLFCIGTK